MLLITKGFKSCLSFQNCRIFFLTHTLPLLLEGSLLFSAILGEKETRLLQDNALRNDGLQKLVLSLRAERSNLKGFQFHRELLYFFPLYQEGIKGCVNIKVQHDKL